MEMLPLLGRHNPCVELTNLVVLAGIALVIPVTLTRDNIAGGLPRRFGNGLASESWCARSWVDRGVAVWELETL